MNHLTQWSCLLAALLGLGLHVGMGAEKPLNILVLLADDWRYDTLAARAMPSSKLPTWTAWRSRASASRTPGVTTPICGVSRASLFTGQWMSRSRKQGLQNVSDPVG